MSEKFRVAVLTILEVETSDRRNAENVAEAALKRAIREADVSNSKIKPMRLQAVNGSGEVFEATVTRQPVELNAAIRNNDFRLGVEQEDQ